jgi:DNA-binding FadR family transcriptional regulator
MACFLPSIYRTLRSFMKIEIEQTHKQIKDLHIVEQAHRNILDGILSGSRKTTRDAFRAHIQSKCFQVFNRTS